VEKHIKTEAEKRGCVGWKCQIVRMRPGSAIDRLVDEYIKNMTMYAHRKRMNRAVAIRELLQSLVDRKRKKLAEPEQMPLFSNRNRGS